MKKCLILLIALIVFTLSALDETKTIGETEFSAIQNACLNDDLINYYCEQCYTLSGGTREDWDEVMGDRDYHGAGYYEKRYVNLDSQKSSSYFIFRGIR